MDYKRHECVADMKIPANFGKEQHITSNDVEVTSFLGDILPISHAANEVEQTNPRVAYRCRLYALDKASKLYPKSRDHGVCTALIHQVNKQFKAALKLQGKGDAHEMQAYYLHYYGNYIQGLKNANKVDCTRLVKAYQIAAVLFEVLKAVSWAESVAVADEIFKAHEKMSTHNILPFQTKRSDQALPIYSEIGEEAEMYTDDIFVFETESSVEDSVIHPQILKAHTKDVAEKAEMHTHKIVSIDPENEDQIIPRHREMKQHDHLRIPLHVIKKCTQDFNERNSIGKGGYGNVYMGVLTWADYVNQLVAVKRQNITGGQGKKEFYTEITMLSVYQHENIITLIGFCDDYEELILVYEYASHGSLDTYLHSTAVWGALSWEQRLKTCIGVASALNYLHNHVAEKHRIIHRDIKCANILLDENWNAKLADFGLARIGLANQQNTFVITNLAGTHGYCDPEYEKTGILTKESDIYSFGVVLFEVLCGRLACVYKYADERRFLHHLARTSYNDGELEKIIDPMIKKDIKPRTLITFSSIAYRCLQETRAKRPTIAEVVLQLKNSLEIQLDAKKVPHEVPFRMSSPHRAGASGAVAPGPGKNRA